VKGGVYVGCYSITDHWSSLSISSLSQVLKRVTYNIYSIAMGYSNPAHYLHTLLMATNFGTCSAHQCQLWF